MTLKFCLLTCLCLVGVAAAAEEPADELASDAALGMASQRPAEGPSVEVENGFMVPYTERIPGTDVTFEMIPVPGGTFTMGSPADEAGRGDDEGPQLRVAIPPMWVAKEEVSWAEYKQFMNLYSTFKEFEARQIRPVTDENLADAITAPTELYEPSHTFEFGEDDDQSAVTMTQYAARQYTKWLSRITGRQYRLPTEAEWEYAARGGSETPYSWGDVDEIEDYAWHAGNAEEGQMPGALKKSNPFGLHDMHGNVAEWTVDAYSEEGFADRPTDRVLSVDEAVRWPDRAYPGVVRGGSWQMEPPALRSAARLSSDDELWKEEDPNFPRSPWWFTSDPARGVGFRLFRSYVPKSEEEIRPYWEINTDDVRNTVRSRLSGGRGVLGLVDKALPAAIEAMENQ